MSNSYTCIYPTDESALIDLVCSDEEFAELEAALEEDHEDEGYSCGMVMYRDVEHKMLYPKVDDGGDPDLITDRFLKLYGAIIGRHGHEFIEFDVCNTSDDEGPGTHGGYKFRIYAYGALRYPKLVWD